MSPLINANNFIIVRFSRNILYSNRHYFSNIPRILIVVPLLPMQAHSHKGWHCYLAWWSQERCLPKRAQRLQRRSMVTASFPAVAKCSLKLDITRWEFIYFSSFTYYACSCSLMLVHLIFFLIIEVIWGGQGWASNLICFHMAWIYN